MDQEFGGDIITLTDEEGEEYELEQLDLLEYQGVTYMAFIPADADMEGDEIDFIILKVSEEDGEEMLVTLDSDEEMEKVYELFMERMEQLDDDGE